MKVYIGADHRGYSMKEKIIKKLQASNYTVIDEGTDNAEESCDYPKIAYKVASGVSKSAQNRGILICMSGIGQAMAANKVKGAYAALCYNAEAAELSRRHNNANVLVLSAKFTPRGQENKIVENFLKTEFEGGRHKRRVAQIKKIENGKKI